MPELARDQRFRKPKEVYLGHRTLPVMIRSRGHSERVSTYMELSLLKFLESYRAHGGYRSVSGVMRHLIIAGAEAEGYHFAGNGR